MRAVIISPIVAILYAYQLFLAVKLLFIYFLVSSAERNTVDTEPYICCGTVREISNSAVQEIQGNCFFVTRYCIVKNKQLSRMRVM